MLLPVRWLTSRSALAERIGARAANAIVDALIGDEVEQIADDRRLNADERVRWVIKRAAKRILAARKGAGVNPAEVELLRRLEEQVRAGVTDDAASPGYDPTEVEHLLSRLDVLRCKSVPPASGIHDAAHPRTLRSVRKA